MFKALLLSSLVLNVGLLLGRLAGFAREAFVAATYGASAQADTVVLMLTVPDLLVSVLIGGALGSVLIPEFTQRTEQSRQLLYQSLIFFGAVFFCITALLYLFIDVLLLILAPGFSALQFAEAESALRWVIWLVPLTVSAGVVTAYLHAQNRFAIAALGTLIINTCIILGLVLVYFEYGSLKLVATFVLLGGFIRLLSQLTQVKIRWAPFKSLFPILLTKPLMIRYGQAMLSGSVLLLFPVVARAMASYEGEGGVALFNYATRLVEFPLAISITFIAAVFFPRLAQSFTNDAIQHRRLIKYGVQITLGLSMIAVTSLLILKESYASFVYGYGEMQGSSVLTVAMLAGIGLTALPLQGFSGFITSVFNARKNTRTPMILNGTGLIFFLLATNYGLFGQGLAALMWGIVASFALICSLQLMFLKIEEFSWRDVFFDKMFLLGLLCSWLILAGSSYLIQQANLSAWFSLLLVFFVALLSLFVLALFNAELRSALKVRLSV